MQIVLSVNGVPIRLTDDTEDGEGCMAATVASLPSWRKLAALAPALRSLPGKHCYVDFDEEADVLYISFRKPQRATHSKILDNGVIVNFESRTPVGMTILDVSTR